uniref:Uncharacterized protein n=1 Tax=Kalanchoe fedtschenkoi TaxID=63787 RepID=A0A7N0TSM2_KALFE
MWNLGRQVITVMLTVFSLIDISTAKTVPAMFVFGDSLLEVGNNNYIATLSKANYIPNGIDFGGPTGRFTNGRTIIDILGQEIGIEGFIPPYMAPSTSGDVILKGVNYASGSGGILNLTGLIIFIKNINMDAQLDNFANTRQEITSLIGETAAKDLLLNNALFTVGMGSNDFVNNYLIPIISKGEQTLVSPQSFVSSLITRLRLQLKRLYSMDARKFVVANVAPIGCIPYMRDANLAEPGDDCYDYGNQLAQLFNRRLKTLVSELSRELEGSAFVYANTYHIFSDILQNYTSYGFENADFACCSIAGRHGGLIPCTPPSHVCRDRSKYVFWDPYHPSDAANVIIANRLLHGTRPDVWPVNIRQLLKRQTF